MLPEIDPDDRMKITVQKIFNIFHELVKKILMINFYCLHRMI